MAPVMSRMHIETATRGEYMDRECQYVMTESVIAQAVQG